MDIVEHCGAPRYLHNDFPLGNPCGVPFDAQMQLEIMRLGLQMLEKADKGGSIERSPFHWKDDLCEQTMLQSMTVTPKNCDCEESDDASNRLTTRRPVTHAPL